MKRHTSGSMIALTLAALLLVFGGGVGVAQEVPKEILEAARQEGKLMVYGSLEAENMKFIQTAFEAKYGVKVEFWRASVATVLDRVLSESRAGKPLFDVVLNSSDLMKIMKSEGVLAKYALPASAQYPEAVRDKDGVLSPPYRVVVISILYNTKMVKPEEAPKTLKDLTDPKWRGKIALPDPVGARISHAFSTIGCTL